MIHDMLRPMAAPISATHRDLHHAMRDDSDHVAVSTFAFFDVENPRLISVS
jgi:hypothetical protein